MGVLVSSPDASPRPLALATDATYRLICGEAGKERPTLNTQTRSGNTVLHWTETAPSIIGHALDSVHSYTRIIADSSSPDNVISFQWAKRIRFGSSVKNSTLNISRGQS